MCVFSSNIYISTFFILSLCVPHFSYSRGKNRLACWFFWTKKWACPAGVIFNKKKSTGLLPVFLTKSRLACWPFLDKKNIDWRAVHFFLLTHQLSYCSFFGLGNNLHVDRVFFTEKCKPRLCSVKYFILHIAIPYIFIIPPPNTLLQIGLPCG